MTCSTCGLQDWKLIMGVQKIVENALEKAKATEKEKKEV